MGQKKASLIKLMPAFEKLNKFGIKAVNAVSDALEKINFDSIAEKLGGLLESIDIDGFISGLSNGFAQAGQMVSNFFAILIKRAYLITSQTQSEILWSQCNLFSRS